MDVYSGPSTALLAANRRLWQLRETHQGERVVAKGNNGRCSPPITPAPLNRPELVATLPPHLGWESTPLTAVLRPAAPYTYPVPPAMAADRQGGGGETAVSPPAAVKLYPDIALGMLREGTTAVGRLWLLCHHLDAPRCGKLRIDILSERITDKKSAAYLCGKRQLRNLLRRGEGLFWARDRRYIWLRSAARVAQALGVARLTGWPVTLPLPVLLGGIGDFRAHLYAAFHSGRGAAQPAPIARATLSQLSGVGRSSQRNYETRLGLMPQANFAIGEATTTERQEERAWQQGTAFFTLTDHKGSQGRPGRLYLAWQLPNSYAKPHQRQPKGRQKRINRQLKDLVMQGMPGNGAAVVEAQTPERLFFADGRQAAQMAARRRGRVCYWPSDARRRIWRLLESSDSRWFEPDS